MAGSLADPIAPGVAATIAAGISAASFVAEDQAVIFCAMMDSRNENIGDALLLAGRRLMHCRWWDDGEPHFRRGPTWSVASLVALAEQHPGIGHVPIYARRLIDLRTRQEKSIVHYDYARALIGQIGEAA